MATEESLISSFIVSAPPGELPEIVNDVKSLTSNDPSLLHSQTASFQKHNEEQFTTVKIPGSSKEVIISPYNCLSDGRYYDVDTQTSFAFDHATQEASSAESHVLESKHGDLVKSLLKTFTNHAAEHFPSSAAGVYPIDGDTKIALVLVASKYSPNNFWNGRWRSQYTYSPSTSTLSGCIKVDVHYYEDGNVRLLTEKPVSISSLSSSATAQEVCKQIAAAERKYQEDLNRAFMNLSEGVFKSLRRQLPVTRQKVEWDKVGGYRLGQDIGGGRSR